jgi:hypothetical protein
MKETHYAVYIRARDYWNTRFNDIHVPLAYLHGRVLLLSHPAADADVVIPAILLHDVGWKSIPEADQGLAYGPTVEDESLRRLHEVEGARIATEILSAVNYDPRKREMIVHIIDGHDTRAEPLSEEDSLVKDADKIWRFTPVGVEYHHLQFHKPLEEYVVWLGQQIDRWFFTERGKQMARQALAEVEQAVSEVGHV